MGEVTLVLGGARSGKSSYAQALAEQGNGDLIYIATAQAFDSEMTDRIERHKADRGPRWHTIECPVDLAECISGIGGSGKTVLVDCLTLWLTNVMLGEHAVPDAISKLKGELTASPNHVILVSNDVGQGIVPDNALARRFRDEAGRLNQEMAIVAKQVWFVTAGLPQRLK